jgi:hypothetical protein
MKAAAAFLVVTSGFAQAPANDAPALPQQAYRNWRETDPNLERDATSAGPTLGARADKVAAEAAKYFNLQRDDLASRAAGALRSAALIEPLNVMPDAPPNLDRFLTVQEAILRSSINRFAADPDRAIQQLRAALQREQAAIAAIAAAVKDSQMSKESAAQTSRAAEQVRAKVSGEYQELAVSFQESEQIAGKSGAAWAVYYRALSDAARGAAAPVTSSGLALPVAGEPPAAERAKLAAANPVPSAAPTAPPVPLMRYVGAWTYPTMGAVYHGLQPEAADLVVREENGQASGTLTVRFRLPAGSTGNPTVHLDFAGSFVNSMTQKFAATASSGVTGTLELTPGPAFNLLEVNFSTSDAPGMIRQGNFLLIKQ